HLLPWILPTGDDLLDQPPASRPPRPAAEPSPADRKKPHSPDYNDSRWRRLDLPHDWGVDGAFQQELPGNTGKLPWAGSGWYRKRFHSPASDAGRRVFLELDGAMARSAVWLNGRIVGGWPYGYSSWRAELTPFLKPGAENVLAVRLENPPDSSRWYPGSGLYRNVWLLKTAPLAVAQWGVAVTTPLVTRERAVVSVNVILENADAGADALADVAVNLYAADETGAPAGAAVASGVVQKARVSAGKQASATVSLEVAKPRLWGLRERNRYVAEVLVTAAGDAGNPRDRVLAPFGIRAIANDPERGFFLNGEHVPLRGVCQHHDLGALGAALNTRALERQLEILRDMGCNAIRTSHNPPAPELLELCDRMGFLVMVEAFDCWALGKRADDYARFFADWHEKDLRAMVRRDRNHPCVIQWSIGNELRELSVGSDGWKLAARLAAIARSEDATRPVTVGMHIPAAAHNGFQNVLDVVGFNYKPAEYAQFRAAFPRIPFMGSETASTISSRGEYFFPVSDDKLKGRADFQVSSYDLSAPPWAWPPDVEWRGLDENPSALGEFVWTGFDYLGEPTPYNADATNLLNFTNPVDRARVAKELKELAALGKTSPPPSRSSYFGIVDLAGFPKDRYFLYQSRWRPDLPMAHILPHWNWPGREGELTPVHVYSSGDEAELFLNGKSLGKQKRAPFQYRFRWDDVRYAPGELRVATWKNGKPWAEAVTRTTGPAAQILLDADRPEIAADGRDLAFVTVTIADKDGLPVPRSKHALRFTAGGAGEIVATDNGDATDHTAFTSTSRRAYNALALVIVRAKMGAAGEITLRAETEGLPSATLRLKAE
ncbi:MAG: DUF4982 domain-containing protein, partial [Opitutaceae bacterium]|nr:DUF4982 domain-containing protein [Opitutaceae bacterium]